MTAPARRPGCVPVALAGICAALNVWSFAQADWNGVWGAWLALFLTEELWATWAKTGGTFSTRLWAWIGIRPRRPWRKARIGAAGVFCVEFGAHVVTGGVFWWSGSWAIAGTAVPVAVVVGYALLREREGSVGRIKLWFVRKFARGPLEKLQADLKGEGGMKMSPAVKSILVFVVGVIVQATWDYYQMTVAAQAAGVDVAPLTFAAGARYVVTALVGAFLFWTKSGRLPSLSEVKAGLETQGNIAIANDNPADPVRVIVSGKEVPQRAVLESLVDPAPGK